MRNAFIYCLKEIMKRYNKTPGQLADDLDLQPVTINRWLSGTTTPNTNSCRKLLGYCSTHPPDTAFNGWPEFREYAIMKYPDEIDEDMITMIEDLIERARAKKHRNK